MTLYGILVHPSVTLERVQQTVMRHMYSLDNPGICIACGADAEGCDPDTSGGECESCHERAVYGAQELLLIMTA